MSVLQVPKTAHEVAEMLRHPGPFAIHGSGSKSAWMGSVKGQPIALGGLVGIEELNAEDQVAVVLPGTKVAEFQEELRTKGLCLPLPMEFGAHIGGNVGTLGGLIAANLPHGLFSQHGGPRDWLLGCTIARPDGTLAKSGSKAVKSVAGYDAHKLMVGARGSLGVLVSLTLRLFPRQGLLPCQGEQRKENDGPCWIHRVLRSDFSAAMSHAGESLIATDPASSTLWVADSPVRFPNDCLWSPGGDGSLDSGAIALMKRAKDVLDPEYKLNRGVFGAL